jgi:TolA-binding protein
MKSEHDSVDDLVVLARRGDLSARDEKRLRELLAASPEARLLHEAGRAFDEEAPVVAGDDERIERIERAVQKRLGAPRAATRRRWVVQACFAIALIGGAAVAGGELLTSPAPVPGAPQPPTPPSEGTFPSGSTPTPASSAGTLPEVPELPALSPSATTAPTTTTATPPDHVVPRPLAIARKATAGTPDDTTLPPSPPSTVAAPELFSAANRARVRGETQEAVRLSRELEDRFPTSREAITTHLSLGLLYLQEHEPGKALDEFRRYKTLGAGATTPEAIWGESQALHQLGRTDEERKALEELLQAYPQSAYSSGARKRLSDMH